jgi:hypothetical protein
VHDVAPVAQTLATRVLLGAYLAVVVIFEVSLN